MSRGEMIQSLKGHCMRVSTGATGRLVPHIRDVQPPFAESRYSSFGCWRESACAPGTRARGSALVSASWLVEQC